MWINERMNEVSCMNDKEERKKTLSDKPCFSDCAKDNQLSQHVQRSFKPY